MSEQEKETSIIEELKEKFEDDWHNMSAKQRQEEIDKALDDMEHSEDSLAFLNDDEDDEEYGMLEGPY